MSELLLEIFSEEIPARMQKQAAADLGRLVGEGLKAGGLAARSLATLVGPRRLVLVADGLPKSQPDTLEERKGPQVGAPELAIQGFLKAAGLASLDQAERRELPKGTFYFAVSKKPGRATAAVVKDIVEAALGQFPWPKSMRWAHNPARWVRPLHGIVCILEGEVVPVTFAGITAGAITRGHRFLAPGAITVKNFADYQAKLRAAFVLIDPAERAQLISSTLAKLAVAEGLRVKDDAGLLAEVTGLVEWPVPLLGTIDAAFMDVPAEVLTSAMRKHQKYFALTDGDGKLANRFGVVANMATSDRGKAIIAGNERVLRSRLSDAKFFWVQDKKRTLESRLPKLEERVFQAKLGTMRDKADRIARLAAYLAAYVPGSNAEEAHRAGLLCKADLSSDMVGEFPDLQGIMGRYYALHDYEPTMVANAIADHYAPLGPNESCPKAPVSIAVACADKIDSLVGFFAIDEKPTGSKDPYALRRAALGLIRIVLENKLRLALLPAFGFALGGYGELVRDSAREQVERELLEFFADRLKAHLRDKGVRHDLVAAVFARGDEDDLVRFMARVDALAAFVKSDDGANLLVAYRRAANIVRIEEKKDGAVYAGEIAEADLGAPEASALLAAIAAIETTVDAALHREGFAAAMAALADLRQPVDRFFDKVKVNADEPAPRAARLRLLSRIQAAMDRVADFSKIEG